ncbi:MAG: type II secretion system minor pseudopilin GspK [Wenzhouxiangella sp.]|jgi:general secretion pathway protein K|nr:type II secretion system minor pseudopilin GspK [Wenzhouxiangella sp.]
MKQPRHQNGSALLIALVAVALATVIAVSLLERAQSGMARTEAVMANERSYQFALGMNALVQDALAQARAEGLSASSMSGVWTPPYDVPGGYVQGRLLDRQGRFNLNALANPDPVLARQAESALERLLDALGLPRSIAAELADWIEGDAAIRSGSVGDFWYQAQQPPYRMSGLMLAHVSELRWLRSVDQAVYDVLRPHVAALPESRLQININTTTPEVLVGLIEALDLASARRVLADGPFNDAGQLRVHPVLAPLLTPDIERLFVVDSQWFLAQARVRLAGTERDFFRLLAVDGAGYDFRYVSQGLP